MAKTSIVAQGQIWYVFPDVEDDAKTNKMKKIRPWLIISPDIINFTSSGYIGFPITHSYNPNDKFKVEIDCPTKPGRAFSKSWVITYKPRLIDETDLSCYIGVANKEVVDYCIDRLYDWLKGNIPNYEIEVNDDYYEEDHPVFDVRFAITTSKEEEENTEVVEEVVYDEFLEDYKLFNPKCSYVDKYINITNSNTIDEYIRMYASNKKQFMREFGVSTKSAKILKAELGRYYNFLMDRKLKEIATGS